MHRLFVIAVLILVLYTCTSAQEIGVKLGNVSTGNVAIDAVFTTSKLTRIHTDLSFGTRRNGCRCVVGFY